MKGHEGILKARGRGYRPAGHITVYVGQDARWQRYLLECNELMITEEIPMHPQVCLMPNESARTADWFWCQGLIILVEGDDEVRVMAAHDRIVAAGAKRVISSCGETFLMDSLEVQQQEFV
jgi:hypothetical protein